MSDFEDWFAEQYPHREKHQTMGNMEDAYAAGAAAQIEKDAALIAPKGTHSRHLKDAAAAIRAQLKD